MLNYQRVIPSQISERHVGSILSCKHCWMWSFPDLWIIIRKKPKHISTSASSLLIGYILEFLPRNCISSPTSSVGNHVFIPMCHSQNINPLCSSIMWYSSYRLEEYSRTNPRPAKTLGLGTEPLPFGFIRTAHQSHQTSLGSANGSSHRMENDPDPQPPHHFFWQQKSARSPRSSAVSSFGVCLKIVYP